MTESARENMGDERLDGLTIEELRRWRDHYDAEARRTPVAGILALVGVFVGPVMMFTSLEVNSAKQAVLGAVVAGLSAWQLIVSHQRQQRAADLRDRHTREIQRRMNF